jgi:hypothetical protein
MDTKRVLARPVRLCVLTAGVFLLIGSVAPAQADRSFIPKLVNSSTIPGNGDLNPYGVVFVPEGFPTGGKIETGDVLVSNFNDGTNAQGKGTTIIALSPRGTLVATRNHPCRLGLRTMCAPPKLKHGVIDFFHGEGNSLPFFTVGGARGHRAE